MNNLHKLDLNLLLTLNALLIERNVTRAAARLQPATTPQPPSAGPASAARC